MADAQRVACGCLAAERRSWVRGWREGVARLDSLDGAGQHVWRHRLEVLQHEHAERVAEHPRRLAVVAVRDGRRRDEELKRVVLIRIDEATRRHFFYVAHTLLAVCGEAELLLVAPEDGRAGPNGGLGKHVVQVHDLLACAVADDDKEAAVAQRDGVLNERADPRVDLLPHRARARARGSGSWPRRRVLPRQIKNSS